MANKHMVGSSLMTGPLSAVVLRLFRFSVSSISFDEFYCPRKFVFSKIFVFDSTKLSYRFF